MKIISIIVFTLLILSAKAQRMVKSGSVWNVKECLYSGGCSTVSYHFGSDTVIGMYQYKLLVMTGASWYMNMVYAMREDTVTKKIFFYKESTEPEMLAYDFSLVAGASYTTVTNGYTLNITVNSTDTIVLMNGELRKRMMVNIGGTPDIWIEGIGSLQGPDRLWFNFIDLTSELLCFNENNILKYRKTGYGSCFISSVGIIERDMKNELILSPNPSRGIINISFKIPVNIKSVVVSNAIGEVLLSSNKDEIDLSSFSNGLYFIRIKTDIGDYVSKVLRD